MSDNQKIESGVQLFSRINKKANLYGLNPVIFQNEDILQNQTIEITSDFSTDGSDMLIDFIVRCILPSSLNPCWKGCGVILINTHFQISVFRIINVINFHLKENNILSRKSIIEQSLNNLTFYNCYDKSQWKLSIFNLQKQLQNEPTVSCLVMDDIGAFYWIEKQKEMMLSSVSYASRMCQYFHNAIKDLNVLFIFGRTENNEANQIKQLTKNVNYKILLGREGPKYKAHVYNFDSDTNFIVTYQTHKSIIKFEE